MNNDKEQLREYIRWINALLTSMETAVRSDNPESVWKYGSFHQFARKYNQITKEIAKNIPLPPILDLYDLDKIGTTTNTIAHVQKSIFESVHADASVLKGILEGRLGVVDDEIVHLRDFFKARLRSAVLRPPEKEREIQDVVEQLLIGRGLQKGEDYDREVGRVKVSAKEAIPDLILLKLSLAVELKLVNSPARMKEAIDEINADIAAYSKKYRHIIFIVYDLGHIRDEVEFRKDLESSGNVSVLVVKH